MEKKDTDIRDIYRAPELKEEVSASAWTPSELIEQGIRKQQIFNISATLLILLLTGFLLIFIAKDFLLESKEVPPARGKTPFIASYTLPIDEQWALEYRQVATLADDSEAAGTKAFSSKWVKNAAYHIIMGEQAVRMNEQAVAQDHFESAIKTVPTTTGIRHYLGTAYLKQQYFEKAVEQLQKAKEELPSIDVLNNLGVAYMEVEDYVRAEPLLQQAIQQQPDLAGCYKNLAFLYQKTGRTNEAVTSFEKYFSLNPQDTALIQAYVAYLSTVGRSRDAISFLDRVKGADPLAVQMMLAKAAAQDDDEERAVRALQEVARFLTPRRTMVEMHDASFEKIARTEPFEELFHRLELAAVSLSTNLDTKGESKR